MKRTRKNVWILLCKAGLSALLLSLCAVGHAQLATNLAIDLRAMSLGNAVTADPPGVSAVHYNPAGLAKLDGRRADFQLLAANFSIKTTFTAPPGYGVFGYSDDPVVCTDRAKDGEDKCSNFRAGKSEVAGISLYIPILDDMVDLPAGMPVAAPLFAFSIKPPGSKFTFANAMYAPMVAGFYREDGDPGNFLGQRVAMERITLLSPSVAYQVNDELSVGASIGLSYQAIALETGFRSPNELLGIMRLLDEEICPPFKGQSNVVVDIFLFGFCNAENGIGPFDNLATLSVSMEQSLSPTYNLGLLWEPTEDFAWGMVYQSQARMHLHGKFAVSYGQGVQDVFNAVGGSPTGQILLAILGMPSYVPPTETGLISMDLTYPAHFQTGIKYKILPDLQINFDIGWTDYGEWDAFNLKFDRTASVLQLARLLAPGTTATSLSMPLGYQSPWSWGIGMEYSWNERLKFRLGFEPRNSAIPDDKRSSLVPINQAQMYGLGMGYQFDKDTDIDFTVMYLYSKDGIPADTSCNVNCTGLDNIVYNPYAGLDVQTKATITMAGIAYRTKW
ncbi:MAG: outer membrane protein transport protein [Pedobacter sp.]|nr:outer membrane protein transport protein [Pedobacter sp.]